MAIAFGALSSLGSTSTVTSVAVGGANTIGIVFVSGDVAADNISAVTWNGVSMTKIGAVKMPSDRWLSAWFVLNPASSTNIVFTGGSFWSSYSFYYTGAKQSAQPDSFNTGTVTSTSSLSVATTVVAANCWAVWCGANAAGPRTYTSITPGTFRSGATGSAGMGIVGDSNGVVTSGSYSVTTVEPSADSQGAIAFSIAPFISSASNGFLPFT
jgi:hypothetical protein